MKQTHSFPFFLVVRALCVALLLATAFIQFAHAITDDFTVQTMVGEDTTPPSIPTNLIATPITPTQIDLSWDPSTDDWILSGYHVWRDDVLIATTTATNYTDIGLTASTTYRYYLTAFDGAWNESASSTEVSTTTPNPPVPPDEEETRTTYGTRLSLGVQLLSLEVIPGQYGVVLRYTTSDPVRAVIRYGETTSYEIGSLREQAFLRTHETFITGLAPDTKYTFSIDGEMVSGRYGVMHTGTFTTLLADDIFPPGNVTNLQAVQAGDGVVLTWDNPNDADFDHVRILRSDRFYPTDTADGWLVYEGDGESAYDGEAATYDGWRYYTVFAYDAKGNIASGAIIAILIGDAPPPQTDMGTTTPLMLVFPDVQFLQEDERISEADRRVVIDGSKQLTVSIPYGKLPEHLKTIILEIRDVADPTRKAQFLLRAQDTYVAYTATLAPFGISGEFAVAVTVYDFKTRELGRVQGTIESRIVSTYATNTNMLVRYGKPVLSGLLFLGLLFGLVFLGRRLLRPDW